MTPNSIFSTYNLLPEDSPHRKKLEEIAKRAGWDLTKSAEPVEMRPATSHHGLNCQYRGVTLSSCRGKFACEHPEKPMGGEVTIHEHCSKCPKYVKRTAGKVPLPCYHMGDKVHPNQCSNWLYGCNHPEQPHGKEIDIKIWCMTKRCEKWEDGKKKIKMSLDEVIASRADWWLHGEVWPAFRQFLKEKQNEFDGSQISGSGDGIVIAGGGKYFVSSYVNIRLLRHLGCNLPIELWYLGRNKEMNPKWEKMVKPYGVKCVDADELRKTKPMRVLNGWELKPYAIMHSAFNRIAFMDADCHPCVNPEKALNDLSFMGRGALFFRDKNQNVGNNLSAAVWGFFGIPARSEWALESGALFIDKSKWGLPLWLTYWMNSYSDLVYKVVYGDKDTFGIAARLCGYDYAIPPHEPGGGRWGLTQKWFDRSPFFYHRIHDKFRLGGDFPSNQITRHPKRWGLPYEHEMFGFFNECMAGI